ncbi:siderophore ABC transporter substrate-binding protein [Paracoccus sp. MBLB3053]|uniref:Siderophore ABC transporter substrate-binding protein n=1 Tax=Paracoccus aurantius TaxID=3073814 RepID=A0ABU2HQU0_9RHOB|nr:siderophore ABC transporter substrate-binding protein [Paracoccus sp. MBLB3053]MDS9466959.1 siderophore ABC transporter substrate-binding protein [Paracoccus sp. MBLB3053]
MRALVVSAFLAFSTVAVSASEIAVPTAIGDVRISSTPQKVAVFDIPALDTLTALGVEPAGIPDKLYVKHLSNLSGNATVVGTLFEPNLEALAGLAPDLVIVGGRSAAQKGAIEQVAPAIDMTIGTDLLADARARIDAFGRLFDRQDKAAELLATIDQKVSALGQAGRDKGTALVLMTNGPKLAAYGTGSRFGWIHEATGMPEASGKIETANHGDAVSHEFVAEANPDWLFVIDRGAAIGEQGDSAEATLKSPLIEGTTAWKSGHVVYLNSADAYIAAGGYTATVTLLDQLAEALTAK